MSNIWRIGVADPKGIYKHTQDMGVIRIDGHPVPELEGDGNCRECSFVGDAASLDIGPRDSVFVEWSEDSGVSWKRRYSGLAITTGSPQHPSLSAFKLTGLMKKLEEAEARLPLAKGPLDNQVLHLVGETYASGQWDSLLPPQVTFQDVPAITSDRVVPNYQSVASVFKEVLCKRLDKSRVAVNAEGRIVFGVPSGTLLIDEATPGVQVEWQEVGSEELLTDVRLQWTAGMNASFLLPQPTDPPGPTPQLDPGSPPVFSVLTHTSEVLYGGGSVGAPQPDNWPYGHAIRSEGIPLDASDFTPLAGGSYSFDTTGSGLTTSGTAANLCDDDVSTAMTLSADFSSTTTSGARGFTVKIELPLATLPDGFRVLGDGASLSNIILILRRPDRTFSALVCYVNQHHPSGIFLFPDTVKAAAEAPGFSSISVTIFIASGPSLLLRSCCPVYVGVKPLTVARAMDRHPSPAAGIVTLPGWVDPQPTVQIQRRGPAGEALEIVELPGALYTYEVGGLINPTVDTAVSLQTKIQLGQPGSAESLGLAALIKARDRKATLRAITVAS